MTVIRELIKNEGFSAFFKGLTPKVLYVHILRLLSAGEPTLLARGTSGRRRHLSFPPSLAICR
jgi:hypothetical protein